MCETPIHSCVARVRADRGKLKRRLLARAFANFCRDARRVQAFGLFMREIANGRCGVGGCQ
jgi:hypothetical protein